MTAGAGEKPKKRRNKTDKAAQPGGEDPEAKGWLAEKGEEAAEEL